MSIKGHRQIQIHSKSPTSVFHSIATSPPSRRPESPVKGEAVPWLHHGQLSVSSHAMMSRARRHAACRAREISLGTRAPRSAPMAERSQAPCRSLTAVLALQRASSAQACRSNHKWAAQIGARSFKSMASSRGAILRRDRRRPGVGDSVSRARGSMTPGKAYAGRWLQALIL